jgi:ribonuclease G
LNKKIVITKMRLFGKACLVMAVLEDDAIVELQLHPVSSPSLLGNIYIGMVEKVLPEIKGAFVKIQPDMPCYYSLEEKAGLRPGDEIVVQVCQEALKTKVPKVTSNLNLSGKYMVLTSEKPGLGVSAKLDQQDRKRLKSWVSPMMRKDWGIIVRTNAAEATKEELEEEILYLYRRMETIGKKGKTRTCYSLLEEAQPFYLPAIRDIKDAELQKVVTDIPQIYENILTYYRECCPESLEKVQWYEDRLLPLYKLYSLESALSEAEKEKVWLKSGGFLVIQQTEAFVAVDVNTGKYAARRKASETYRKINLEAAKEIARQLRLRNLYGIILIDFINMDNPDHREELLHVLASYLRKDPIGAQVVDMTRLQITEVTRKKMRKSLDEQIKDLKHGKEGCEDE